MRSDAVPSKMDFKINLYGKNSRAPRSNEQLRGYVDGEALVKVLWCEASQIGTSQKYHADQYKTVAVHVPPSPRLLKEA